jgi:hypothetical protein
MGKIWQKISKHSRCAGDNSEKRAVFAMTLPWTIAGRTEPRMPFPPATRNAQYSRREGKVLFGVIPGLVPGTQSSTSSLRRGVVDAM